MINKIYFCILISIILWYISIYIIINLIIYRYILKPFWLILFHLNSFSIQITTVNRIINFLIRWYCNVSTRRGIDTKEIWKESFGFWWTLSRFNGTITNTFVGNNSMHSHKTPHVWEQIVHTDINTIDFVKGKGNGWGNYHSGITRRIVKSSSLFPSSHIPWNT